MKAKLLAVVLAALALGIATTAGTARADAPTITSTTTFVPPASATQISAACGFTVLQTFTVNRKLITFTDDTGTVTVQIRHVSFEGSLINPATGEALPWHGVWTQTLDVAAGTNTIDGLRQDVQLPGQPPAVMQVGHLVLSATGSLTTPLDASTRAGFTDFWNGVCPAFES
jgi:uncharacterized protein YdeI (BOF family)